VRTRKYSKSKAFTLVEFALVLLIMALLVSTLRPAYLNAVNEYKSKDVIKELEDIALLIEEHYKDNGVYPDDLDEIISPVPTDPWGNPYEYLRINGGESGMGQKRKDKNLIPINSDFDLFSMGPDGMSTSPLTANISRDDIVRGRNGDFYGVAVDY
jgi:general secretion pathway protein G